MQTEQCWCGKKLTVKEVGATPTDYCDCYEYRRVDDKNPTVSVSEEVNTKRELENDRY